MSRDVDALPLVDWNQAVNLAGGNPELAEELFAMLRRDLPGLRDTIASARAGGNLDALQDAIHKLHGATAYCGVPRLRASAGSLDNDLRCGSAEDLDNRLATLLSVVDALCALTTPRS